MKFFYYFISHSIFISICAVALCLETFLLLNIEVAFTVLAFVFFSTLSSYNFYWLLSKFYFNEKSVSALLQNTSNIIFFFIGTIGAVCFYAASSINALTVIVSILLTLLYTIPLWPFSFSKSMQQFGFVKTILLSFTWAFVTVFIPLIHVQFNWYHAVNLLAIRFLFMLMLCIIFDRRDVKLDLNNGIQTLATKVDDKKIKQFYIVALFAYIICSGIFFYYNKGISHILQCFFMAIILYSMYLKSLKPRGYLFYYFFVDGLMIISYLSNIFL